MHTDVPNVPVGYRLIELDEVDSTNAEAQRRLAAGELGPLWIRAGAQVAGRGRKGRDWVSSPGNLYATLLLRTDAPVASLAQLGFVACLAVYDLAALVLQSDAGLSLKWPNDVLLGGEKLSGILTESLAVAGTGQFAAAIGCGVNLLHAPAGTRYGATSLAAHGCAVTSSQALAHLAHAFADWLEVWQNAAGFDDIRRHWTDRSSQIGSNITLDLGGKYITGKFEGLAQDGALVLTLGDGTRQVIRAGDVLHTGITSN